MTPSKAHHSNNCNSNRTFIALNIHHSGRLYGASNHTQYEKTQKQRWSRFSTLETARQFRKQGRNALLKKYALRFHLICNVITGFVGPYPYQGSVSQTAGPTLHK